MQRIALSPLLLMISALPCRALVSTNVPLDHWSYAAVEKLANYELVDSAMLTMKPISRVEMARHIGRAMHSLDRQDNEPKILVAIVDRLKQEFRGELILIGVLDGWLSDSLIKPVEDPYVTYLSADHQPDIENVRGDVFRRGSNYRAGFGSRITLFERAAFYLHPEYGNLSSEGDSSVELIEGYGKIMLGQFEIEIGKDSLWWGPAHHGSILMSNNVQPLKVIKITNPQPIQLPWIFGALGPFKGQWFLAELERDRNVPRARLSGVRLNAKPHPALELGVSRVAMFGGTGLPRVGFSDYFKMFVANTEQEENNQLAGFDVSTLVPFGDNMPLRSLRFYADAAGEDEAGGWPSKWGYLFGLQLNDILRTGRTDLRVEYVDTPNVFYTHTLYTSGYTYAGRVIGHHVGTDSRSMFVQISHYLTEDMVIDIAFDQQTHALSTDTQPTRNIFACDLTAFRSPNWQIQAGYRYENGDEAGDDNHILHFRLTREF